MMDLDMLVRGNLDELFYLRAAPSDLGVELPRTLGSSLGFRIFRALRFRI